MIQNFLHYFRNRFGSAKAMTEADLDAVLSGQYNATVAEATQISGLFACANLIASGVAQVPFKLKKTDGKTKSDHKEHNLYDILEMMPNEYMTSFEWRQKIVYDAIFYGFHLSYRNVVGGRIEELLPIPPSNVTIEQNKDYSLTFNVTMGDGKIVSLSQKDVLYIKGISLDGVVGKSVIQYAKKSLSIAHSLNESAESQASSGMRVNGIYSVENALDEVARGKLTLWLKRMYSGANAGNPIVVDRSAKFTPISMTNIDAQTLETRLFQIQEICRFLNVSPLMIYADEKLSTYAGSVQMVSNHVTYTLDPWYVKIQQAVDTQLLTKKERKSGIYSQFLRVAMLQGDLQATINAVDKQVNGGLITPNEGRVLLDYNPIDNPEYDKLREKVAKNNDLGNNTGVNSTVNGA